MNLCNVRVNSAYALILENILEIILNKPLLKFLELKLISMALFPQFISFVNHDIFAFQILAFVLFLTPSPILLPLLSPL